jgi:hypothetical protein
MQMVAKKENMTKKMKQMQRRRPRMMEREKENYQKNHHRILYQNLV